MKIGLWEGQKGSRELRRHWYKSEMVEDWIRVETVYIARGSRCVNGYVVPWVGISVLFFRNWNVMGGDVGERAEAQSLKDPCSHSSSAINWFCAHVHFDL